MEPKIPATATTLAPLIMDALKSEGGPLRRKDLIKRVAVLTSKTGFSWSNDTQGIGAIKKALQKLRVETKIFNPQPTWWQIVGDIDSDNPGGYRD